MATELGKQLLAEMRAVEEGAPSEDEKKVQKEIDVWAGRALQLIRLGINSRADCIHLGNVSGRSVEELTDLDRRKIAALNQRLGITLAAEHLSVATFDDLVGYLNVERAIFRTLLAG